MTDAGAALVARSQARPFRSGVGGRAVPNRRRSRATEHWRTPPGPEGSNGNQSTGCSGPLLLQPTMADIVYLVRDMLFSSKIREAATQLGLKAQGAPDPAALARAAAGARLVILDLRLEPALQALDTLAADPALAAIP